MATAMKHIVRILQPREVNRPCRGTPEHLKLNGHSTLIMAYSSTTVICAGEYGRHGDSESQSQVDASAGGF